MVALPATQVAPVLPVASLSASGQGLSQLPGLAPEADIRQMHTCLAPLQMTAGLPPANNIAIAKISTTLQLVRKAVGQAQDGRCGLTQAQRLLLFGCRCPFNKSPALFAVFVIVCAPTAAAVGGFAAIRHVSVFLEQNLEVQ